MKKFLNYIKENNIIFTYKNNGVYHCPVCDSDNIGRDDQYDYIFCDCRDCEFTWNQNLKFVFNGSESYLNDYFVEDIKKGKKIDITIIEELENNTNFDDKEYNPDMIYLSNGKERCPYCDSENIHVIASDSSVPESFESLKCESCSMKWRKYEIRKIKEVLDIEDNKIKIGDVVDTKFFNVKKMKNITAKNFNL